jgi:hypothetical protein
MVNQVASVLFYPKYSAGKAPSFRAGMTGYSEDYDVPAYSAMIKETFVFV